MKRYKSLLPFSCAFQTISDVYPSEVVAFTEPWWKLVSHAAREARRLGLEFGVHNCAGYESSGGPWITPEISMKEIVWSETRVSGATTFTGTLAKAKADLRAVQPFPVYNPTTGRLENPGVAARREFYRYVAELGMPVDGVVARENVLDLTTKMSADGRLDWDVPPGDWIIYRFGHTTMGALLQPCQWEAIGLECDKMSRMAVEFHMNHIIGEAKRHLGDLVGNGFIYYHFDSYEAGTPGWTPKIREEFSARRGYDLTPFLPMMAKRTVGSEEETAKFQADFKQTIRDLYRENYFPTIERTLHGAGMKFMCEPYGGPWSITEAVPRVDRIVTEFWTDGMAKCSFAVNCRQPELWNPVTGTQRDLPEFEIKDGRTIVPLEFAAAESCFIVFRRPVPPQTKPTDHAEKNYPPMEILGEVTGAWQVSFDPKWGGPKHATFEKLDDWTQRTEDGIKFYSGTAIYMKTFDLPASENHNDNSNIWLDLGTVRELAEVRLNGRNLGVLWTAPWRVDITAAVKPKPNKLEIRVRNVWANRLIGDEQQPADCEWNEGSQGFGGPLKAFPDWFVKGQPRPSPKRFTFTTWNCFTKTTPLVSSGLLGPVTLGASQRTRYPLETAAGSFQPKWESLAAAASNRIKPDSLRDSFDYRAMH